MHQLEEERRAATADSPHVMHLGFEQKRAEHPKVQGQQKKIEPQQLQISGGEGITNDLHGIFDDLWISMVTPPRSLEEADVSPTTPGGNSVALARPISSPKASPKEAFEGKAFWECVRGVIFFLLLLLLLLLLRVFVKY